MPQRTSGTARSMRAVLPLEARITRVCGSTGTPRRRRASARTTSGCDSARRRAVERGEGAGERRRARPGGMAEPMPDGDELVGRDLAHLDAAARRRTGGRADRRSAARSKASRAQDAVDDPVVPVASVGVVECGRLAEAHAGVLGHVETVTEREVQWRVARHATEPGEPARSRSGHEPGRMRRGQHGAALLERGPGRGQDEHALRRSLEHAGIEQARRRGATDVARAQGLGGDHAVVGGQPALGRG